MLNFLEGLFGVLCGQSQAFLPVTGVLGTSSSGLPKKSVAWLSLLAGVNSTALNKVDSAHHLLSYWYGVD